MAKIEMKTPLVEMDGDEMTRIIWQIIKDELICPYVDLKTEYYDLGLREPRRHRRPGHRRLRRGHQAPGRGRQVRHHHPQRRSAWRSTTSSRCGRAPTAPSVPSLTARSSVRPSWSRASSLCVRSWKKPITIARHAYGDVYKNAEMRIPGPGKVELVYTAADGTETRELVHDFTGAGVVQGHAQP